MLPTREASQRSNEQLSEPVKSPTEQIAVDDLTRAQETLLIPLWARALEANHAEPILKDDKAVELVDRIDYPFRNFSKVVEMGAGLDTRFDR